MDLLEASLSVSSLLRSPGGDLEAALSLIHEHFRLPVATVIRKLFPSLPVEDLKDVWSETLKGVAEMVVKRPLDDQKPNFFPLLCTIAIRRARDLVRREGSQSRHLENLGSALKATQVGRRWQELSAAERTEVMRLISEKIATLPSRQRLVMQAFVDNHPESEKLERLREAVAKASGQEETSASVKRAKQEAFEKLRLFLRDKGYDLWEGGET